MKIKHKISSKISILSALIALFLISCSTEETLSNSEDISSSLEEPTEFNEIEFLPDPDAILIDNDKNNSSVSNRNSTVKVSRIRVYLSRDNGAYGKISLKVFIDGVSGVVAQSGYINVANLAKYSTSSKKYTSAYFNLDKDLKIGTKYRLEVQCKDCPNSYAEGLNVYWWRSNDENYRGWTAHALERNSGNWIDKKDYDFTFNIQNKRSNGSRYNNQSNFKRDKVTIINTGTKYAQLFMSEDEFPCDVFDDLRATETIKTTNGDKKIEITIHNDSNEDKFVGDIILYLYASNQSNSIGNIYGVAQIKSILGVGFDNEASNGIIKSGESRTLTHSLPPNYSYANYELFFTHLDCDTTIKGSENIN